MPGARASIPASVAAGVVAVLAACLAQAYASPPNAQQGHGTEGAFATGLYERELGPTGPQRWTGERATYRFAGLSTGPASLEVRVRGHRTPLSVLANGAELGTLSPERFVGRYDLPAGPERGRVVVELVTEGFRGGDGRVRGALVDRVRVRPSPSLRPSWRTLGVFLLPAFAIALSAAAAGFVTPAVVAFVAFACLALGLLLRSDGLLYSPYATTLAILLALAGFAAGVVAFAFERRSPGTRRGAFAAVLLALAVQGIAPVSPVMVASDVVFHANRLRDTLAGEWFPVSVTQHVVPFQIPYGVSFYALLVPLGRLGLDPVLLVTAGAGLAGVAASVALFGLFARRTPALAVAATIALQLLPGTFTIHSYGNLSNAFGQAATVLFFCWWSGAASGGALVGALLYAVAGTSHLSSLIVLGALSVGLVVARGRALRADRVRLAALGLGAIATVAYYSHFVPLVLRQLPRLLEGGGQGKAGSAGALQALGLQLHVAVEQFGIPALLLAVAGLGTLLGREADRDGPLRDVAAYLAAVGLLALPAVVSPLEVRYLYALGLPVAVSAAAGYLRLRARGVVPRTGADLLALAQAGLAAYVIADCIFFRYRQ